MYHQRRHAPELLEAFESRFWIDVIRIGCITVRGSVHLPDHVELQDRITKDLGYVAALINKLTHLTQLETEFLIESLLDAPNNLIINQIISNGKDDDGGKLF